MSETNTLALPELKSHRDEEIEKLKAENAAKSIQISGMKTEIDRLKQIVTEPGEGNRYRLLMNDNAKLTKQNEILKGALESLTLSEENSERLERVDCETRKQILLHMNFVARTALQESEGVK